MHEIQGQKVVACCDRELAGKFIGGDSNEIAVKEEFYGKDSVDAKWLKDSLEEAATANLLGERVVSAAVKMGYIKDDDVIKLAGVPHAQIFRI